MITAYSPAAWNRPWWGSVPVDDRCVNEGAQRADGSFCRDKAEESGWCARCSEELFPPGWETKRR